MMRTRILAIGAAALAAVSASAQFTGPAPLAWRFLQPTTVAPSGSPLVNGDNVYTSVGGRVFAIDRTSGNLKWRFPQLDPIAGTFRSAPILVGDVLVLVGDNKIVYGIDPVTGESKWTSNTPGSPIGQPVVVDNKYFAIAQSNNSVALLNGTDGQPVWTAPFKVDGGILGSIGSFGSEVLIFNNQQELLSVNAGAPNKPTWKRGFQQLPPTARPVVFGDAIYVYSGPFLVALNAATGVPRGQVSTGLQPVYSPAISADGIVVVGADGKTMVYDIARQPITPKPIDLGSGPITAPIIVGNETVTTTNALGVTVTQTIPLFVVPTSNGALNLVNPKSGIRWSFIVKPLDLDGPGTPAAGGGGGRPGGPGGGPGFGGGSPGLGGGGGLGGGQGGLGGGLGGGSTAQTVAPTYIQASGAPVLAGTTLIVPAKDGSLLAFDTTLGVDLTAPKVTMQFPNSGDQVSGQPPLVLVFKLEDEASGIDMSTLKITIDGQPVETTTEKDGRIIVRFSTATKNRPLSNGRRKIVVNVKDWLGNEATTNFALTIDNALPPVVLPGAAKPGTTGGPGGPGGGGGGSGLGGDR